MKQTPKRQTLTTFADRSVKSLATQFGGWHKLLDPAQPLPVEFIEELKNYIWERELIDYVRSNECVSEAESTTREVSKRIAEQLYLHLTKFYGYQALPGLLENGFFWDSMHLPAEWDEAEETMKAHNISRDMVASIVMVALGCHPTKPEDGKQSNPPHLSGVPRKQGPDSGDTSIKLPLPEREENF